MSDEELDNLFKEAAESHHALHDPEAWQDMASRLDKEAVTASAPGIGRHLRWTIPVAVIVVVGTYLLWPSGTEEGTSTTQVARQPVQDVSTAEQPLSVSPNKHSAVRSASSASVAGATPSPVEEVTPGDAFHVEVPVAGAEPSESQIAGKEDGIERSTGHDKENVELAAAPEYAITSNGAVIHADQKSVADNHEILSEVKEPSQQEAPTSADTVVLSNPVSGETGDASSKSGRLFLRLAASPDLTSINYFHPGKVGVNYGMNIEYLISSHWSVITGVIWSRKIYSTTDVEGYSYGNYNVRLSALDGDCRILDIPLNAYYHFSPGHALTLSVGAGFSSYVMMREDYTYWTQPVNGHGPYAYNKSIAHENNEWFKLLNLSVMVERQLGNRVSLQIEPFVKAPLAGVGDGKVSLVSAGAFFNVRYKIK